MADRPIVPRWALPVFLVVLAGAIAAGVALTARASSVEERLPAAEAQRDAAAGQAVDLATLIADACRTGHIPPEYAAACLKAAQVQAQPVPGPAGAAGTAGRDGLDGAPGVPGAPGAPGSPGTPGRDGQDGRDGAPGAAGAPGSPGQDGRGVASSGPTRNADGVCVFRTTYTDGTSSDAPSSDSACPPASSTSSATAAGWRWTP